MLSGFSRCARCEHLTLARMRRCLRCKALMPFAYTRIEASEQRIDTTAVVGVAAAITIITGASILWFEDQSTAFVLGALGLAVGIGHLLLPWFRNGWIFARLSWLALTLFASAVLWREPILALAAAAVTCGGLCFLELSQRSVASYLNGEPTEAREDIAAFHDGSCAWCSNSAPRATAPLWCVSFLFMTSVTIGRPRYLCVRHARLNAIPATAFAAVFGWWGIPWGFIRTPSTIWRNLSGGGVSIDSNTAESLRRADATGHAGWFNFLPGVRSKWIAVLGFLLFMTIIFGSMWSVLHNR